MNKESDVYSMLAGAVEGSGLLPAVVIFTAEWSPHSEMIRVVADKVNRANDKINLLQIDIDQYPELAADYNISQVPTVIIIQDKVMSGKSEGMFSKMDVLKML